MDGTAALGARGVTTSSSQLSRHGCKKQPGRLRSRLLTAPAARLLSAPTGGGSENLVKSNIKDSYSFIQSLTVYSNPKEKGLIYTQYRGEDNYDVWKIYEGL